MSVPVSKPAGDAAAAAPNGGAAKAAATSMVVDAFSAKVAGAIKPVLDKAAPAFAVLSQVFAIVYPYIEMAFTYLAVVWEKLQPYHPQEFMPAIAGFVLVFFGGNFFTLAAAVEAYRMVGFDDTKTALIALHKSYKVALDASKKDDEVDEDDEFGKKLAGFIGDHRRTLGGILKEEAKDGSEKAKKTKKVEVEEVEEDEDDDDEFDEEDDDWDDDSGPKKKSERKTVRRRSVRRK